ncbi:hypothetical protein 1 [Beihai paphia shell virus 2]|uniref:hypothetical protein 1 n=1 Tax=Beihai paphia shell virus 2 TaxID=1922497 RepID=UPI00090C6E03|nr:hypothetical protein 1 [Beihai paphia shell virus 2]APG78606.1 hypothetical protein 1 [Beihai paphia shell virus 2]APG78963.1 hypothetical protein 2 [Beihai paphia shell virus 2]
MNPFRRASIDTTAVDYLFLMSTTAIVLSKPATCGKQTVHQAPHAFEEDYDDSCWVPVKESNTQKHCRRVQSKALTNKKKKKGRKKNKPLDPHVFHEILGNITGACSAAQKTAGDAEMAFKLANNINNVKEAIKYKGTDYDSFEDNLIARIEDIVALVTGLSSSKTFGGFLSVIHLYLRTHYPKPVSKKIMEWINDIFGATSAYVERKAGEFGLLDHQSGVADEFEDKLKNIRSLLQTWKTHRHGELSKNLCNIVNILVTFGVVPNWDKDPLTLGKFQLFKARAWDVQKESGSFIEVILDTVVFFLERGYAALVNNDMSLLLYSDTESYDYENEYSTIVSILPLLEAGKLSELKSENFKNDQDFEVRLEALIARTFEKLRTETSPHMRNTLTNKLITLKKTRTALIMNQKSSCVREKPFGVLVYGGSSVGKSSINATMIKVLLSHNNYPSSKKHVVTLNDSDKFQSEYRAYHTAVTLDDFGNTRAEHYTECPTNKIIDFLNNVPKAALNPNVELKGNVMIQPKIVTVTTNKKDLMAHSFSNEPVSVLRRFNIILDVRLRSSYVDKETGGLDGTKIKTFVPDAWLIDVQQVKIIRTEGEKADTYEFKTLLKSATFFDTLEFLKNVSSHHFALQRNFVSSVEELYDTELCPHSYVAEQCPHCLAALSDSDSDVPDDGSASSMESVPSLDISDSDSSESGDDSVSSASSSDADCASYQSKKPGEAYAKAIDNNYNYNYTTTKGGMYWDCADFLCKVRHDTQHGAEACSRRHWGLDTQADEEVMEDGKDWEDMPEPVRENLQHESLADAVKGWYADRGFDQCTEFIKGACTTLRDAFEEHKKEVLVGVCAAVGISTAIFAGYKIYKKLAGMESFLSQGSEEKPPVRLETDMPNPWKAVKPVEIPKSEQSTTTTVPDLLRKLRKSLGHAYLIDEEAQIRRKCDIVPMQGNCWLLPSHMLDDKTYKIQVQTTPENTLGLNFTQIIDPSCWIRLTNDFALVRLVNGGPVPNLSKFLPMDDFKLTSRLIATFVYKSPEGEIDEDVVHITSKRQFESKAAVFEGMAYNYPRPTFPGLCMGTLVASQRRACIVGFHLAGRTGSPFGVAGVLTQKEFDVAYAELTKSVPLMCHSAGHMLTTKYDINFTPTDQIEKRHCVNWLADDEEDGQQPVAEVLGAHPLATTRFKSQVRKSPISEQVAEIMQLPRIHGAPSPRNIGKHWSRDLTLMAHPKGNFVPSILDRARADLMTKVMTFLDKNPEQLELVHPYPKDYVLSGVDGVASVDRVQLSSSMGFPINKKKKFFLGPVDRGVPGVTEPIDFDDPKYWAEVERMEEVLANGERVYVIHRGNLKDEPTKFTKDKIRVFAGCEFAFTCVVRKYFLPIVRLIQSNWKEFECAVGVNSHSRQWSELKEHITRFGGERMIAGDYKAFDKAATPLAMLSSFEILIQIAVRAGYSERQITIMRGCATEICYPLYELDGVLVQLFGSNPSGHPLTVIINNLENSLYLRYAYYAMHEGENVPLFDERVALICYGDDNAMDVSEEEDKFNHTSVASELAKVGITYTMADKEAESIPFIPLKDISFLKRGFVWNDDVHAWLAPLEVASISKPLHNYMHRKGSDVLPEDIAASAIRTANGEFFYHGREVFEVRRKQLMEVAESAGLGDRVGDLETYADLCDRFTNAHTKRSAVEEPNDFILDIQSGEDRIFESALQQQVISDFGIKPVIHESFMGNPMFGSPDLVFYKPIQHSLYVIETKVLNGASGSKKKRLDFAKHQAKKYAKALNALVESFTIFVFVYTEEGYKFVQVYNYSDTAFSLNKATLKSLGVQMRIFGGMDTKSGPQTQAEASSN